MCKLWALTQALTNKRNLPFVYSLFADIIELHLKVALDHSVVLRREMCPKMHVLIKPVRTRV